MGKRRSIYKAAMEELLEDANNAEDVYDEEVDVDETLPESFEDGVDREHEEVEAVSDIIEDAGETIEGLEAIKDLMIKSLEKGGLDKHANAMSTLAIKTLVGDNYKIDTAGLESLSYGLEDTKEKIQAVGEWIKKIWEKIWIFLKHWSLKIYNWIKSLFTSVEVTEQVAKGTEEIVKRKKAKRAKVKTEQPVEEGKPVMFTAGEHDAGSQHSQMVNHQHSYNANNIKSQTHEIHKKPEVKAIKISAQTLKALTCMLGETKPKNINSEIKELFRILNSSVKNKFGEEAVEYFIKHADHYGFLDIKSLAAHIGGTHFRNDGYDKTNFDTELKLIGGYGVYVSALGISNTNGNGLKLVSGFSIKVTPLKIKTAEKVESLTIEEAENAIEMVNKVFIANLKDATNYVRNTSSFSKIESKIKALEKITEEYERLGIMNMDSVTELKKKIAVHAGQTAISSVQPAMGLLGVASAACRAYTSYIHSSMKCYE